MTGDTPDAILRTLDLNKWNLGDCIVCSHSFTIQKIPFKVCLFQNLGYFYCCSYCGQAYIYIGQGIYSKKET